MKFLSVVFTIGQVAWKIRPLVKSFSRFFFLSGRSPETIRPLAKFFLHFILHRAGHLEKWYHLRNSSRCFFLSGRSPGTIRSLMKSFSRFILHWAGHLEKWDHSWNPSRCFFLLGRSPGTIRRLAKLFWCFILHRAGHLEKWDHSRNPSRCFFLSGRSPGTIDQLGFLVTIILGGDSLNKTFSTKKNRMPDICSFSISRWIFNRSPWCTGVTWIINLIKVLIVLIKPNGMTNLSHKLYLVLKTVFYLLPYFILIW